MGGKEGGREGGKRRKEGEKGREQALNDFTYCLLSTIMAELHRHDCPLQALRNSGVNFFPEPDAHKYVSITAKVCVLSLCVLIPQLP